MLRRIVAGAVGVTLLAATWTAVAQAQTRHHGSGTPTVVVDYFGKGKLLATNSTPLAGFDLKWSKTGCTGKWLSKPVIVVPANAPGTTPAAPIPAPCDGTKEPAVGNARRAGVIETVDTLGWLVTGSTWWVSWSVTKDGHGPPLSSKLAQGSTGIRVYLYGGNSFTAESWVTSDGKITAEKPQAKIPAGATEAYIHVSSATS